VKEIEEIKNENATHEPHVQPSINSQIESASIINLKPQPAPVDLCSVVNVKHQNPGVFGAAVSPPDAVNDHANTGGVAPNSSNVPQE